VEDPQLLDELIIFGRAVDLMLGDGFSWAHDGALAHGSAPRRACGGYSMAMASARKRVADCGVFV
jgi:hypothetical protein